MVHALVGKRMLIEIGQMLRGCGEHVSPALTIPNKFSARVSGIAQIVRELGSRCVSHLSILRRLLHPW